MDLEFNAEESAFRDEVRAFLSEELPTELRHKVLAHQRLHKDDFVRWHRIVDSRGWAAANWPLEYGGTGWGPVKRHIWEEECSAAGAPIIQPFGVHMVGPVIIAFGNEAQKKRFLPPILRCDEWWCQGYSEPGAGSDLASLKTRATRDGDHYIVNGQKTWTTLAQYADWMFCLVRTDPSARQQAGISFLLIDMRSPGITLRPIRLLDEDHEVNEVFLDNVRVPVENLVGEENKGWTYAKFLLGHERTNIAAVGRSKRELAFLKAFAARRPAGTGSLLDDPLFAQKVARVEIELMALEMTVMRVLAQEVASGAPGPEASLLKIKGTDIQQRLTELMVQAAGPMAQAFDPDYLDGRTEHSLSGDDDAAPLAPYYFNYRKTAIYGGSNEIQHNIIARMILGL